MKIALIGYGKMGKMIDAVAKERRVEIVARLDRDSGPVTEESLGGADVCIDFSHPDSVLKTIGTLCELGKDVVVGTTGWRSHLASVQSLVEDSKIGLIHSPNFSIGMQVYMRLVQEAAKLVNCIEGYDVGGCEIHHRHKGDSPSGTAVFLAETLCRELKEKKTPVYERLHREILPDELQFASVRGGYSPGNHMVFFDSQADTIELRHRARTREGFAIGALLAAEWVHGKKGLFTLDDLLDAFLSSNGPKR